MKNLRKFSGTTSAKKEEARMRNDVKEALECGVSSDIANRLLVRGKRHEATLPNINYGDIVINRGHDKKYGVRPEKKKNRIFMTNMRSKKKQLKAAFFIDKFL